MVQAKPSQAKSGRVCVRVGVERAAAPDDARDPKPRRATLKWYSTQAETLQGVAIIWVGATYLGVGSNNVAEYQGLLDGLQAAVQRGTTQVLVSGDSDLIRRQLEQTARVGPSTTRHEGCWTSYGATSAATSAASGTWRWTPGRPFTAHSTFWTAMQRKIQKYATSDAQWVPKAQAMTRIDYQRRYTPSTR